MSTSIPSFTQLDMNYQFNMFPPQSNRTQSAPPLSFPWNPILPPTGLPRSLDDQAVPSLAWSPENPSNSFPKPASFDDDEDDDLNIDTSHMTQEEKNELKAQRKLRKMNREKVKRSRLNDQFDHLCKLLAIGKSTRVEKLSVLNETIRHIQRLKTENDCLKKQKGSMSEVLVQLRSGIPCQQALPKLELSINTANLEIAVPSPVASPVDKAEVEKEEWSPLPHKDHPFVKNELPTPVGGLTVEECWGQMFQRTPQPGANHDLDFAFGTEDGIKWLADTHNSQPAFVTTGNSFSFDPTLDPGFSVKLEANAGMEANFKSLTIPKEDDNVDMFLSSDSVELLSQY